MTYEVPPINLGQPRGPKFEPECPRIFRDRNGRDKSVYCRKWNCPTCAEQMTHRIIRQSLPAVAEMRCPTFVTVRTNPPQSPPARIVAQWKRLKMRIGGAKYIGLIDHTAETGDHIHAIIDAPGNLIQKHWSESGGGHCHTADVEDPLHVLHYILDQRLLPGQRILHSHGFFVKPRKIDATASVELPGGFKAAGSLHYETNSPPETENRSQQFNSDKPTSISTQTQIDRLIALLEALRPFERDFDLSLNIIPKKGTSCPTTPNPSDHR